MLYDTIPYYTILHCIWYSSATFRPARSPSSSLMLTHWAHHWFLTLQRRPAEDKKTYIYIYIYHISISISLSLSLYIYIYIHMYNVYTYIYIYIYMQTYVYVLWLSICFSLRGCMLFHVMLCAVAHVYRACKL